MATRFVKFAPENQTAADALSSYLDQDPTLVEYSLAPNWSWHIVPDKLNIDTNQNWMVAWPYDGPFQINPGEGFVNIPKPTDFDAALLSLGVIVDTPDWYDWDTDPAGLGWVAD